MSESNTIPGPLGRRPTARWRTALGHSVLPVLRLVRSLLPRTIDLVLSITLLVLMLPLLAIRGWLAAVRSGQVFERETLVGQYRSPFERLRFAGPFVGREAAVLINILRGDMSWVGPRPLHPEELLGLRDAEGVRFMLVPGLISPHHLREKVGIAYDGESHAERELYYGGSAGGNLGVIGRSLLSSALGGDSTLPTPGEIAFFGIHVVNTTMQEAVDWLIQRARADVPSLLSFVNPDCLNIAYRDEPYRDVLRHSARVLPDGIGLRLGCRLMGVALKANVNGTDLFPRLCEQAAAARLPIFLLGARPGVAEQVAENMIRQYPGLSVAGTQHGYFEQQETDEVIERINRSGARILLVAFGAPRQEKWLHQHRDALSPPVRMGVGGLLDFYSGRVRRAPIWMREIGLEWLFRMLQEPGRLWRRYIIGNPLFLYRVWLHSERTPS